MTIAFPTSLKPSQQSSFSTKYRSKVSNYGDGIIQVAKDGLNSKIQSANLVFPALNQTEYDDWVTFSDQVGTWEGFTFAFLDDFTGNVGAKWRITEDPTVGFASGHLYSVTISIERIFGT